MAFQEPKPLGQMNQQDRAEDRAGGMAAPTDHRHRQDRYHDLKLKHRRGNHPDGMRLQGPGGSPEGRAGDEQGQTAGTDIDPAGGGGLGRVSQQGQAMSAVPLDDKSEDHDRYRQDTPDHQQQSLGRIQRRAGDPNLRHAIEAVGAAGHLGPVDSDQQRDL